MPAEMAVDVENVTLNWFQGLAFVGFVTNEKLLLQVTTPATAGESVKLVLRLVYQKTNVIECPSYPNPYR